MSDDGRLAENVAHFARALRRAGLPVGPAAVIVAIEAVETVGVGSRQEFYWALHSVFVTRRDHHAIWRAISVELWLRAFAERRAGAAALAA